MADVEREDDLVRVVCLEHFESCRDRLKRGFKGWELRGGTEESASALVFVVGRVFVRSSRKIGEERNNAECISAMASHGQAYDVLLLCHEAHPLLRYGPSD